MPENEKPPAVRVDFYLLLASALASARALRDAALYGRNGFPLRRYRASPPWLGKRENNFLFFCDGGADVKMVLRDAKIRTFWRF